MKEIDVEHCETKMMIADTLTKGLPRPAFEKHRCAMNIGDSKSGSITKGGLQT